MGGVTSALARLRLLPPDLTESQSTEPAQDSNMYLETSVFLTCRRFIHVKRQARMIPRRQNTAATITELTEDASSTEALEAGRELPHLSQ